MFLIRLIIIWAFRATLALAILRALAVVLAVARVLTVTALGSHTMIRLGAIPFATT